ncbi:F-box/WD repeat-containing protein 9 [Fasciola hepatica]|uniref:F-box/WD repeat-containing protein 9 n=1 Tax=Fasciola hepatica TaxID=6192 RepID=A0A4E0R520_FASHE|nr:F-box/WD repeat-containing protein 9 [Fasciola hepatica]
MCSLDSLPFELFRLLCLYLRASDVVALKAVCKKFHSWLGTSFWKKRVLSLCAGQFPCRSGKSVDWISCAIEREYTLELFGPTGNAVSFSQHNGSSPGIDAVHIPPDHPELLVLGDRGRMLTGFSLHRILKDNTWNQVFSDGRTHLGWIWTIKSCKDSMVTGSWDGTLRSWAITNTDLVLNTSYKLHAPVLCSNFLDPNTVAASAFLLARVIDLRLSPDQQSRCLAVRHQKAILCMGAPNERQICGSGCCADRNLAELRAGGDQWLSSYNSTSSLSSLGNSDLGMLDPLMLLSSLEEIHGTDQPVDSPVVVDLSSGDQVLPKCELPRESTRDEPAVSPPSVQDSLCGSSMVLYTGSDDHFLAGWDLRYPSKPVVKHQFVNYPRKMGLMDNNELWVAEPPGRIHVFDIRHGSLECVYTNELPGWVRGFGGLEATPGGVYACGLHGTVDVFHPTKPIIPMGRKPIAEHIAGSPTCMAYSQGILTVGAGDGSIYIWTSKNKVKSFLPDSG